MAMSPYNLEEKPYNVCLNCVNLGKKCDGPNFLAMTTDRWCEWCHLRKEYLGWTNARVAELAGVSKISVDRIMSGNVKDLRNTTMQAVTKALVNGTWGQYPCAISALSEKETVYVDNPALVDKCERLQATLDSVNAQYAETHAANKKQIDFLLKQIDANDKLMRERYDFLKRKDRIMQALAIVIGILLTIIIAALIVDILNHDVGFLWLK